MNNNVRYKYTEYELDNIDKAWNLIEELKMKEIEFRKYRDRIIKHVSNNYTIDDFFILEKIIEKLYWNLKEKIKEYLNEKINIKMYNISEFDRAKKTVYDNKHFYRSYANKTMIIQDKTIYVKETDLMSTTSDKTKLETYVQKIINNRDVYETIMLSNEIDDEIINNLDDQQINSFDYPYPNVNTLIYNQENDDIRKKNIKYYYYSDNDNAWLNFNKIEK